MVSLISIACLLLQPDIGNAILLSLVALAVVFFWGVRKRFMIILLLLNFSLVCVASLRTRYSTRRLENFLYRRHPSISYQSFRAIQAIENGGLIGVGAGKGTVKKFIPDAYSDFIFAVIGEELGLIGCAFVAASFLLFFVKCILFAYRSNRSIEGGSIFGISETIFLQSWIHMASVVGLVPTKGITLPFISHGGSSMVASWVGLGLIIAMSRSMKMYNEKE